MVCRIYFDWFISYQQTFLQFLVPWYVLDRGKWYCSVLASFYHFNYWALNYPIYRSPQYSVDYPVIEGSFSARLDWYFLRRRSASLPTFTAAAPCAVMRQDYCCNYSWRLLSPGSWRMTESCRWCIHCNEMDKTPKLTSRPSLGREQSLIYPRLWQRERGWGWRVRRNPPMLGKKQTENITIKKRRGGS